MKFAHMSDVHLGVWSNHPELKELAVRTFEKTIDRCIEEKVDFIVMAGDLFDTSLPPIDVLKRAVTKFRECREAGIRIYAIAGSHDFSPTAKTMLGVLEEAGLMTNIARHNEKDGKIRLVLTEDGSGAKLAGISGKKGALEGTDFENLEGDYDEEGFKIFAFHSAISEYRPEHLKDKMKAVSLESLPNGFDYYAAGHIHQKHIDEKNRVFFPSSLFPCDFDELERNECGFYIVEAHDKRFGYEWERTIPFDVALMKLRVDGMKISEIENSLMEKIEGGDLKNKILLIKLEGVLDGRQSDINFKAVTSKALEKGAITVKRSIHVTAKEFEEVSVRPHSNIEQLEKEIIRENPPPKPLFGLPREKEERLVLDMMNLLRDEKQEDETNSVFEERVKQNAKKILGL